MNVLVFAPHPDDEVLGCGGVMARLAKEGHNIYVCVATRGYAPLFSDDVIQKTRREQKDAHEILGVKKCYYLDYPAAMLEESHRYEFNNSILSIICEVQPELVLIPHEGDMQKDHGIVSEAVMVAVRPRGNYSVKKVLSYETMSETEWNIPSVSKAFVPNCYYDISDSLEQKMKALACFKTQIADFPNPRSLVAVKALAEYRGSTVSKDAAEAFYIIREIN